MSKSFKNKKVWITGASSGIGRALSIALNTNGAICILSARSVEGLNQTKSMCDYPENCHILPFDVLDKKAVLSAVSEVDKLGGVDILINNAGRSQRSKAEETQMHVYRSLMELNYFAVVNLTKLVLPQMIEKGEGSIVTISSVAGKVGPPYRSGYAASKHALHGFFDSLRAEITHKGIHVLVVCPGYINTPIAHNALAGDGKQYNKSDAENANGLDPNDLAQKILKSIKKKKTEVYFGQFEVNAVRLKRFWPAILTHMLHRKFMNDPEK